MLKRIRVIGIVLTTMVLAAPGARADHIVVAPPFDQASDYASCFGVPPGTCTTDSEVDAETGSLSFLIDIATPMDGQIPGIANGGVETYFTKSRVIPRDITGFEVTITIRVDDARAEQSGAVGDTLGVFPGYSSVGIYADVSVDSCYCYGGAGEEIAYTSGTGSVVVEDEEIVLTALVRSYDGGPVRAGTARLFIAAGGYASVNGSMFAPIPEAGHALASLNATVTSVTAHVV